MPYIKVSSNASRTSVDVAAAAKAFSKTLAVAIDRPEGYVMAEVSLDRDMIFAGSADLCAFVNVRSIGQIDAARNVTTVAALTETVSKTLGVATDRVYVVLNDIPGGNWGVSGKPYA